MKSFTKANDDNQLEFTWSLFIFLLLINCLIGDILALTVLWEVGIGVGFGLFLWEYGFLGKSYHNSWFIPTFVFILHELGKQVLRT